MYTPNTINHTPLGLTGRGYAVAILRRLEQRWPELSSSQQAECSDILERLSAVLRREHSVCDRAVFTVPLVGHLTG